jgi:tricorn protease
VAAIPSTDGRPVDPVHGPYPLLAGKSGKPVELTLRRQGTDRRVVVVPLASERTLRYHDMIAARRARVRELSDGRLGYVHVPDMVSSGWAEFHRGHGAEFNREGLIFDLRENGGGHTSQLVIEKLNRKIIGWTRRPCTTPYSYPQDAPRGAVVTLIDEMAGSDGDIAANAIRRYGIGPLVGTRTWGGVVGTDRDRALADRTLVTQPKGANWFDGPGWSIENYGVDPDVEVEISPQDWVAGRDPQLETAVRTALEELARNPAATPPEIPTL